MAYTLVLLRHGESEWNAKNLFTGWVDVPLSDKGRAEAVHGGELLKEAGVLPEKLFTSMLRRAIMTANLSLDAADRHWIPVERDWRLNERHYGALQGKNKKEIRDEYGEEQFMQWRRSYDVPPPPIEAGSEFSQDADPRYAGEPIPATECLKDALDKLHGLKSISFSHCDKTDIVRHPLVSEIVAVYDAKDEKTSAPSDTSQTNHTR